jgi:hypothetical protein
VVAAGTFAVQSHHQPDPWVFTEKINYSLADLRYSNGTLLKGTGNKAYVVLNNHRFWIPTPAMFDAMGYKWENIIQYPDNVVNAIPEGTPFP